MSGRAKDGGSDAIPHESEGCEPGLRHGLRFDPRHTAYASQGVVKASHGVVAPTRGSKLLVLSMPVAVMNKHPRRGLHSGCLL